MKRSRAQCSGIPTAGAILRYLVRALGLPTKEIPGISDKDFERISSEQGTSLEKRRKVIAAIIDRLVSPDTSSISQSPTQVALEMADPTSPYANRWSAYPNGDVILDPPELARIILTFLSSSSYLRKRLGPSFSGPSAREIWIHIFAIPFLASKAAELKALGVDWESGMPGGFHWYLPERIKRKDASSVAFEALPVHSVLRWWQDLLGAPLDRFAIQLCGNDSPDAHRQIRRWLGDDYPPDYSTIERWTQAHVQWNYCGAFAHDPSQSLHEQWTHCRAFLLQKQPLDTKDWRGDLGTSAHAQLIKQYYHGEWLEKEIPPFSAAGISFSKFLENLDPIAAGLPVADFIQRVAYRWRQPTNTEVRVRLMIAAAAQRMVRDLAATIDARGNVEKTASACKKFAIAYDVFRRIIASPEMQADDKKETAVRLLYRELHNSPAELLVLSTAFADSLEPSVDLMATAYGSLPA